MSVELTDGGAAAVPRAPQRPDTPDAVLVEPRWSGSAART